VQGPVGYQVFGLRNTDPVFVSGCSGADASDINMQTYNFMGGPHVISTGIQSKATSASGPWSVLSGYNAPGWTSSNTSVVYQWTPGAGYSDTSKTCVLSNIQGNPQQFYITHATEITDAVSTIGNGPSFFGSTSGPNYQLNNLFRDSILLSNSAAPAAWYNSSLGSATNIEGMTTENFNNDAGSNGWLGTGSTTADHLVWPGRPSGASTNYTAYGNNPAFPVGSPTMAFPAYSYCSSGVVNSNCIGFVTALSGVMPLFISDYHNYALCTGTAGPTYCAGQSSTFHNTASDGTDYGAQVSAIDTAQTLNQYVCTPSSSCPGLGPFPDAP
jgi:hypothetical protein